MSLLSIGRTALLARSQLLRHGPRIGCFLPMKHGMTSNQNAYSTSGPALGLEEFRDSVSREKRLLEKVGRSWTAKELRRKSFDDLWRLWLVLYKERNMLLTEKQILRRRSIELPQPDRWRKVKKSMAAIRHVMGERKREKIAQHSLKMKEEREKAA